MEYCDTAAIHCDCEEPSIPGCDTAAIHCDCDTAAIHCDCEGPSIPGCDTVAIHCDCDTAAIHCDCDTAAIHCDCEGPSIPGCDTVAIHCGCEGPGKEAAAFPVTDNWASCSNICRSESPQKQDWFSDAGSPILYEVHISAASLASPSIILSVCQPVPVLTAYLSFTTK
ncbi:hypothetical protein ACOMHN_024733 [Nucella lapillus]